MGCGNSVELEKSEKPDEMLAIRTFANEQQSSNKRMLLVFHLEKSSKQNDCDQTDNNKVAATSQIPLLSWLLVTKGALCVHLITIGFKKQKIHDKKKCLDR